MSTRIEFGTDGIRGRAGRAPISPEVGVAVGRAAARLARENGGRRVLVARDTRPSGEMLEAAVTAGVAGEGLDCLLAGVLPTSGVSVALHTGLADAGVMITASHNPVGDNGFKVFGRGGAKLDDAGVAQVEAWVAEVAGTLGAPTDEVGDVAVAQEEAWDAWEAAVQGAVGSPHAFAGRRVAIDLANGALAPAAPWLLRTFPADWIVIGGGTGTINDGVGSEHLDALQRAVSVHGCDIGIAVDGDGDRCRIVDERGHAVPGDAVAWLLARAGGVSGLAVTVMSNGALEPSLPGVRIVRTPVGDRHLREAMIAHDLPLGSEESGHVLFGDFPAGDGLVTGLRVAALALAAGSASDAFSGFAPLPRRLGKVAVSRRPPLESLAPLMRAKQEGEARLGPHGRVFLRYSGTEDYLRLLIEGAEQSVVDDVIEEVRRAALEVLS